MRFRHLKGKFPFRGSVLVCGRHLNNGFHLIHVFRDGSEIHRLRKFWSVIVNIQDLNEDVCPRNQRLRPQISDVDRKPVVFC